MDLSSISVDPVFIRWAIHFAEAIIAMLIVLLVTRVIMKYRAAPWQQDGQSQAVTHDSVVSRMPPVEQTPPKQTPQPAQKVQQAPAEEPKKEIVDRYIDGFF